MYIIVPILAAIINVAFSGRCKPIDCKRRDDNFCYIPNLDENHIDSIELSQCPYGLKCVNLYDDLWNHYKYPRACTAEVTEYRNSFPYNRQSNRPVSDYCDSSFQCASGECLNNRCSGKFLEEDCTSNNDCVYNAFCDPDSSKCKPRKQSGESCTQDSDCVNNAGCDNENKCTALYSIGSGLNNKGSDIFCRSGLSVNNICEDYTYLPCYPETETQCKIVTSVSKKQLTYGKCECNPAGGATGFCSPISSNSANYQYWLDEFNKVTQSKCPYESSTSCIQIPEKDYVNYKYAEAILNGYDIEEYYCLVSSSQYLSLSFVLVTLLAIFI